MDKELQFLLRQKMRQEKDSFSKVTRVGFGSCRSLAIAWVCAASASAKMRGVNLSKLLRVGFVQLHFIVVCVIVPLAYFTFLFYAGESVQKYEG